MFYYSLVNNYYSLRKEYTNSFTLEPPYYIITPGYSWDAMKKYTSVEIPQLQVKFYAAMPCLRSIWITNSSDHRRV